MFRNSVIIQQNFLIMLIFFWRWGKKKLAFGFSKLEFIVNHSNCRVSKYKKKVAPIIMELLEIKVETVTI